MKEKKVTKPRQTKKAEIKAEPEKVQIPEKAEPEPEPVKASTPLPAGHIYGPRSVKRK